MTSPEGAQGSNGYGSAMVAEGGINGAANANNMAANANNMVVPSAPMPVPRAVLSCRPNSHPFQERTLSLEQSVKVGRSVARARPAHNNAIFDCKVLSRNHALLWYDNGKFYLQDTKSSNGTFVNNQRLSKGSEESLPREVCSGDILQFGVDVVENSRKVTHGCIIATLKLFLPDGKEAKASPTIMSGSPFSGHLPPQDLYLLNQYIQEALAREQLLEAKLAFLQRIVGQAEKASADNWKALIDEDRLLTRVEILESQLSTYGKSMGEDRLREEVQRLMEEKEEYQEVAKETLTKVTNEKLSSARRVTDLEKQLGTSEEEKALLKNLYERSCAESQKLAEEVAKLTSELAEAKKSEDADQSVEIKENIDASLEAKCSPGKADEKPKEDIHPAQEEEASSQQCLVEEAVEASEEGPLESSTTCAAQSEEGGLSSLDSMVSQMSSASSETSLNTTTEEDTVTDEEGLARLQERLDAVAKEASETGERLITLEKENSELRLQLEATQKAAHELERQAGESAHLTARLDELLSEKRQLELQLQKLENLSESQADAPGPCERSLVSGDEAGPAEVDSSDSASKSPDSMQLKHLLTVKERYAEVSAENKQLESSLRQLEGEMGQLAGANAIATAFSVVPLAVLLVAIIIAYLPTLSTLLGTKDS